MNTISAIIGSLTAEERQEFLLSAKRKNRRTDVKNTELFQLIAAGKTTELDIAIYGKPSKNAYHALCKRLQDSLIDFIASKSFSTETSEELAVLKLLLASRIFFEQKQVKIGFKTLAKAEKLAEQSDVYSILNEIYHTKIQYAHLSKTLVLEDIIASAEENLKRFHQEFQLNQAYAVIKGELRNEGAASKMTILRAFSKFDLQIDDTLTYKSLYQLMEITTVTAELQRDFKSVSPFMTEIYEVVHKKSGLSGKHRYYHIKMLNLMAISEFRNKQFEKSSQFASAMEAQMQADNKKYTNRFLEQLTILKALNSYYTGNPEIAFDLLNNYKGVSFDISLILVVCLFHQSRFSEAQNTLRKFQHSDDWYTKKMGWIWVLKKNMIEILVLIELDKLDLVLLKLERFRRHFSKKLKDMGEKRVLTFTGFVEQYYENPKAVSSTEFHKSVEKSFDWLGREHEDIFVLSFYAWLKAKMLDEDLYTVTLELVKTKI